MLSNKLCNIVAHKIRESLQAHPETQGLLIICVHNILMECKYVMAYAKQELYHARKETDIAKTLEELDNDHKYHITIEKKRSRDVECELNEKIHILEQKKARLPKPYLTQQGREPVESTKEITIGIILRLIVHEFNNKVVVLDGYFRDDGSIDTEWLDQDILMGKAAARLQVAQYLSGYLLPGEYLIQELHF